MPALVTLRFFAALWVVLFHLGRRALSDAPLAVRTLVDRGWLGVPFFFVLSGFILVYVYGPQLRDGGLDRRGFWWARFARIYPMYLFALVLAFPSFLRLQTGPGHQILPWSLLEIVATPFLLQTWLPWLSITWNTPGWSLCVEAFFYASFPWLGAHVVRARRPGLAAAAFLAVGLALQPLLLATLDGPAWRNLDGFPPIWLPFFLYGCLLGEMRHRLATAGRRAPAWIAWGALLAIAVVLAGDPFPGVKFSPSVLAAEALFGVLVLGMSWPVAGTGWMAWPAALAVGEASYALYLLHGPLNRWIRLVFDGATATLALLGATLLGMVAISLLAHAAIERPARVVIRRWAKGRPPKSAPTLAAAAGPAPDSQPSQP